MTELYNMSQEQRDAVRITTLEKQLADAHSVIKELVMRKTSVEIRIHDSGQGIIDVREKQIDYAAAMVTERLMSELASVGYLYERIAQYEQWFYRQGSPRSPGYRVESMR